MEIPSKILTQKKSGRVFTSILDKNQISKNTVIVLKETVIQNSEFIEDIRIGEDTFFWDEITENYFFQGQKQCYTN